jgi:hypothetical protein
LILVMKLLQKPSTHTDTCQVAHYTGSEALFRRFVYEPESQFINYPFGYNAVYILDKRHFTCMVKTCKFKLLYGHPDLFFNFTYSMIN